MTVSASGITALSLRPARRHSVTSASSWLYPAPVAGRVVALDGEPVRRPLRVLRGHERLPVRLR